MKEYISANPRAWNYFLLLDEARRDSSVSISLRKLTEIFWSNPQKSEHQQARAKVEKWFPEVSFDSIKKIPSNMSGQGGSRTRVIFDCQLNYEQAVFIGFHLACTSGAVEVLRGYELFRVKLFELLEKDQELAQYLNKERKSEDNLRALLSDLVCQAGLYGFHTEVTLPSGRRIDARYKPCQHTVLFEFKAKKVTQSILDAQLAKEYPDGQLVIVAPEFAPDLTRLRDCELWTLGEFYTWVCKKKFADKRASQFEHSDFANTWQKIVTTFA